MTLMHAGVTRHPRSLLTIEAILCAVLLACAVPYVLWTWRWPLVGDASLMHYIAFLMDHGMAPYRDIPDINLPGSFLIEWLVIHTYGGGPLAWRLFDLTVLMAMGGAMLAIAWPYDRFAGLFGAVLMMLLHGRDGIFDTGQRDLTLAALVVLGYALLFYARRKRAAWAAGLFGFFMGAAATIKPYPLLLGLILLILAARAERRAGRASGAMLLFGVAGLLLPEAIVTAWLLREHALGAFVHSAWAVDAYFASLGRRPLSYLLIHSFSPLMIPVCIWLVLELVEGIERRGRREENGEGSLRRWERAALLIGVLTALAGFMLQGKGYPYQRYCFVALLLVLMGLDFTQPLVRPGVARALALLGLASGCLFLAPQSLARVRSYDWRDQGSVALMEADLRALGGSKLTHHVQCIDTIDGCSSALYNLQLVSQTGMLSDFLVFGSPAIAEVRDTRAWFLSAVKAAPPWVLVVTGPLFPSGPGDFQKLNQWPEFRATLAANYRLCAQRAPEQLVNWGGMRPRRPPSYRIYVLNGERQVLTALCETPARSEGIAPDALRPETARTGMKQP